MRERREQLSRRRRSWSALVALTALVLTAPPAGAVPVADDVARQAGIYDGIPIRSYGSYPHDFDGDGRKDVLLVPHSEVGGRLYRNLGGGRFEQVAAGTFVRRDRHGCAWADVDQDGAPDVYCAIGAVGGRGVKANELWLQQADGGFLDRASAFGVTDPYGRSRDVTFLDVNHDPYPDLYVTNETGRRDGVPSPNRLFINQQGASFRSAPEYALDEEVGGVLVGTFAQTCVQAVDHGADGWEDLLVCGKDGLRLYRNLQGEAFLNVAAAEGIHRALWVDAELRDLNGDRALDLIGLTTAPALVVQLRAAHGYSAPVTVRKVTKPRQLVLGDVDRDGDLDVYVVRGANASRNLPDRMLLNNGSGTSFTAISIPQARAGGGQSVAAIDHDSNGTADFIVMNGPEKVQGPVQLISFR